jgi:hypothetical protein
MWCGRGTGSNRHGGKRHSRQRCGKTLQLQRHLIALLRGPHLPGYYRQHSQITSPPFARIASPGLAGVRLTNISIWDSVLSFKMGFKIPLIGLYSGMPCIRLGCWNRSAPVVVWCICIRSFDLATHLNCLLLVVLCLFQHALWQNFQLFSMIFQNTRAICNATGRLLYGSKTFLKLSGYKM